MSVDNKELLDVSAEVTLSNCDREPIHVPGVIQPHGILLALTEGDLRIVQASSNFDCFLGVEVEQPIGVSVEQLLGNESATAIRELAASANDQVAVTAVQVATTGAPRVCELLVHRSGGLVICELEPREVDVPAAGALTGTRAPGVAGGVQRLFTRAASEVRQLTGYDRVMVYRFDEDGHGEVIGEARNASLDPLLGHHYPATDIPRQARALYLRQMIRMIVDVNYEPASIIPTDNPLTGEPLDLGLATLRSVSPIHLEYLRNMGVTATLTISLIREGQLWGMIACHHYEAPYFVPHRTRAACAFLGELLSAQLTNVETGEYERERQALVIAGARIARRVQTAETVLTGLRASVDSLAELWTADGVAVLTHDGRVTWGYVPAPDLEAEILRRGPPRRPLVIDRLSRELPLVSHHTELSGVLALPLPDSLGTHIVWYRDDWARELKWGGNPDTLRPDLTSMDVKSLSPRRSFETWRQAVVGQSRPWTRAQIDAATELVEAFAISR